MADINVNLIIGRGITIQAVVEENPIIVNMAIDTTGRLLPPAEAENDFIISNSSLGWISKRIADIKTLLGVGNGGTWGSITGDLEEQDDLFGVLDDKADLDSDGKVPPDQLPDISSLELGETSDTAYQGDRGKIAYEHSQSTHAPSDAVSLATVKGDSDVSSAISLKHAAGSDNQDLSGKVDKVAGSSLVADTEISKIHSNTLDHSQGTDQGLDTGGLNAVTAAQAKAGYTHSGVSHAPSDAVSLSTVKGDSDVADAISKKHSNSLDHTSGNDQYIDHGGANETTAAQLKSAVTNSHASGSDAETATSIINLGIDEIEFALIKSYMI